MPDSVVRGTVLWWNQMNWWMGEREEDVAKGAPEQFIISSGKREGPRRASAACSVQGAGAGKRKCRGKDKGGSSARAPGGRAGSGSWRTSVAFTAQPESHRQARSD